MRDLTIGEQKLLALAVRSPSKSVRSDNMGPVDVNILPMGYVVDTETVDRCVEAVLKNVQHADILDPPFVREIVLSVLAAAGMDIGRGSTEHSEPTIGGGPAGTASGSDNL